MPDSESSSYCEVCDKDCLNDANLKGHLAGRAHREKVDAIIEEDEERLESCQSDLLRAESQHSQLVAENQTLEGRNDELVEETAANHQTLQEQRQQIAENSEVLSTQTPEVDVIVEKVNSLRSERDALSRDVQDLAAKKSETERQIAELTEQVRKAVELRPELEQAARDEIIAQLIQEETYRFNSKKLQRVELDRLYHTGEISLDEFIRRKREVK